MTWSEYYRLLEERYKTVNESSLASIRAYNEYARHLREEMEEQEDANTQQS